MFNKILIANRGEIALRIIRTCKQMGVRTVAVYSENDFKSLHVLHADEAVALGGQRPSESYLDKEKIVRIAKETGAEAIHPGYGFLSENAGFATMVTDAGLVFIGPPASAIAALGDKIAAKKLAHKAGVPTVPGHMEPVTGDAEAARIAGQVGYPVLLKPAAGGGGKGMRIVESADALSSALNLCRQEALKAFGDNSIFIERYIRRPRHIEIQVIGDTHGNIVHLGERECSIQRRYQKIIEESPSPIMDEELRAKMGHMACELAKTAGYTNAGTVEFVMDPDKNFYFLEMNTRLQVEHPVTELVTGLDLVALQLAVANGEKLPFTQEAVGFKGWAMEARVCAEDPGKNFIPSVGLITRYAEPKGEHIRTDSGVAVGSNVSVYYDSMLAKVITWGEDREKARKRLARALNAYHIEGIVTNIDFLNQIVGHLAFAEGDLSTDFIPQYMANSDETPPPSPEVMQIMAITTTLIYHLRENLVKNSLLPLNPRVGSAYSKKTVHEYVAKSNGDVFHIRLEKGPASEFDWYFEIDGEKYEVVTPPMEFYRRRLKLTINGRTHYFRLRYDGNFIAAAFSGVVRTFEIYNPREWRLAEYMPPPVRKVAENILACPMPGLVVEIRTTPGERVFKGQELVVIESMKMETAVSSPLDAEVAEVNISPGDTVESGSVMITFR